MEKKEVKNKYVIVHLDYHLILFPYLIKKYKLNINEERKKDSNKIVDLHIKSNKHKIQACKFDATKFINTLQIKLEERMKEIISTKSIYYWIHLYRRIPPVASFNNESKQTVDLYRNILENAIVKYGNRETKDELVGNFADGLINVRDIANGYYLEALKELNIEKEIDELQAGVFLGNFDKNELIEIFTLERLAYEFWRTTVCIRRINKNGFFWAYGSFYGVKNPDEIESLMKSYDSRGGGIEGIVSSTGITLFTSEVSSIVACLPKYNVEQFTLNEFPTHRIFDINFPKELLGRFRPNFTWWPVDFDFYYKSNEFYKESFFERYGYKLESFIYTLYLILFRELLLTSKELIGIENIMRGYRNITNYESLIEDLIYYYESGKAEKKYLFDINRTEVTKVLLDLTHPLDTSSVSLVTLGPRYLFIPAFNQDFIIDYSAIMPILLTKMHFLEVNEDKKGHLFEDIVIDSLKNKNINVWECKKKLIHQDGTSKEIDISFVYRDILFVGELKVNNMSLSFIKGDEASLKYRKKKLLENLAQADEKVAWMLRHTKGTNFTIPDGVKAIVPFLITPFIEYIWTKDTNMWLSETVPRICTYYEIEKICTDEVLAQLVCKPFYNEL